MQVAFDSTLLALFLSASLMLVQTLVYRRSEDLLARVDRWVVEKVLPRAGNASEHPLAAGVSEALAPHLEAMRRDLMLALEPATRALQELAGRMGDGLGPHVDRFARVGGPAPGRLRRLPRGGDGDRPDRPATGEARSDRRRDAPGGRHPRAGSRSRSATSSRPARRSPRSAEGLDRACEAVEGLSQSWSASFERSNRINQEQLAKTMHSLKDALDLLNVSMEQGNALYRSIVKRTFATYPTVARDEEAA